MQERIALPARGGKVRVHDIVGVFHQAVIFRMLPDHLDNQFLQGLEGQNRWSGP